MLLGAQYRCYAYVQVFFLSSWRLIGVLKRFCVLVNISSSRAQPVVELTMGYSVSYGIDKVTSKYLDCPV